MQYNDFCFSSIINEEVVFYPVEFSPNLKTSSPKEQDLEIFFIVLFVSLGALIYLQTTVITNQLMFESLVNDLNKTLEQQLQKNSNLITNCNKLQKLLKISCGAHISIFICDILSLLR
jgi:hypothetical protein